MLNKFTEKNLRGLSGSGNRLTIANGGAAINNNGYIGRYGSASNNAVLVTGTGSVWNNSGYLFVGDSGSGNTLTITNGGKVFNTIGYLSYAIGASNNAVLVTGAGSVWSNSDELEVGFFSSGNTLTIANGGKVFDTSATIGVYAHNNAVLVTGTGSVWNNSGDLYVGHLGSGNSLTITNGGAVNVGTDLIISAWDRSSNNVVNLTGGQLTVTNGTLFVDSTGASGSGTLNVSGGTLLVKQLTTTDAGGVITFNGGTIQSQGTTINNGADFSIGNTGGGANFIALGGTHSFQNDLYVGNASAGNTLLVTNGATVVNLNGIIGSQSGASNNAVTVTGAGSQWYNGGDLYVGSNGANNHLTIADGGYVEVNPIAPTTTYIGYAAASSNNTVTVTGPTSVWNNVCDLYVGYQGSGNALTIANRGNVINANGNIGYSSDNNTALVTGTNSAWNNLGDLIVGYNGSGNALVISNGGLVLNVYDNYGGMIGFTGTNNTVTVTGAGSVWSNGGYLIAGYYGSSNALRIADGGTVVTGSGGYIGHQADANNNSVTVTGNNSVWNNSGDLYVGNGGSGNSLTIASGGAVLNASGYIGYGSGASNNVVLVTGRNSIWTNSGDLCFGFYGFGNTLTITNGGTVYNANSSLGYFADANNNAVTVTGSNSVWNNSGNLNVGLFGSSNTLTIAAGGIVNNAVGSIGAASSINNAVVVNGEGSVWNNSGNLSLGGDSYGNTLTIANSGTVFNANGYIGNSEGNSSSNNAVTVTGPGSVWSNRNDLAVGNSGAGNSLTIANGGQVYNATGSIGSTAGANSNIVTVTGAGSVWSNTSDLNVGKYGSDNTLTIANGGQVFDAIGSIGTSANNNAGTVTGSGSVWNNSSELYVGKTGSGNSLVISNGGQVVNSIAYIGFWAGANNNSVTVTGTNSIWNNSDLLYVGASGSGNTLMIANGGTVYNIAGYIGKQYGANSNAVLVTGTGSVWSNSDELYVGNLGSGNTLTITNGGTVFNGYGYIGNQAGANNNAVTVTGTGSVWKTSDSLFVGFFGSGNALTIDDDGSVTVGGNLTISAESGASNNSVTINSGQLTVTNAAQTGQLVVGLAGAGTVTINGGTVTVDHLIATNGANSAVHFNGGWLNTSGTVISNGAVFTVGNGVSVAVLNTVGGTHSFSDGLTIASNAWLTGTGTINASGAGILLNNGAFVSPGLGLTGIGTLTLTTVGGYNGAVYDVQISNLASTAGTGWDWLNITGTLANLSSGSTNFIIRMDSLGTLAAGYSATGAYALKIATVTGTLSLSNFTLDASNFLNGGNWQLSVSNSDLYVVQYAPLAITVQPASRVVGVGQAASLSVSNTGTAPFSYQWLKDGAILSGQTNRTLAIASMQFTNSGSYSVVITNAQGMVISYPASLSTSNAPLMDWGWNGNGQLGNGTTANGSLPITVASNVVAMAVGNFHSLFVTADATLWAMGANGLGQLGNGMTVDTNRPVQVASNVVAVAAGASHSLFVKTDGTLWAVGNNSSGQLGDGTNYPGQLGDGTTANASLPIQVASNVVAVAAGYDHSLFVAADGALWAMGMNGAGQLGDGTTTDTNLPITVASNVVAVASGYYHSLFVKADGTLWAMGYNGYGQLGNGMTVDTNRPVQVASNVVAVAAGSGHSLFVKADGTLWAMGDNSLGQLGNGTTISTNLPITVASNVVAVAAGYDYSLFVTADGTLWAMGINGYGELGNGTTTDSSVPVLVNGGGLLIASLAPGSSALHSLAIAQVTTAKITVNSSPTDGGDGTGGGVFSIGSNVVLAATASNGWQFASWNTGATDNPYTIVVVSNTTYTANFRQNSTPTATITGVANPLGGGSVVGGGTYNVGTNVQLVASAVSGWTFTGWSGGVLTATRTVPVPATNITYTANFTLNPIPPATATISVVASPASGGTVSGGGTYPVGNSVALTATAKTGWVFTVWNDGVTNVTRSVTVPSGGATYTATFQQQRATISVAASPASGGSVTGSGTYPVGTNVQITASAVANWNFTSWNDGVTNATRLVPVAAGGATYTATFQQQLVLLSVVASPVAGGTVSGGGRHPVGTSVPIAASAANLWNFTGWSDGESNATRTITVPATNITYTANFTLQTALITGLANPVEGGTVTGGATYNVGTNVQLVASATSLWDFTGWSDGVTNATRTVTVPATNITYTANFALQTALLTGLANPVEGGTVTGGGTYNVGTNVLMTASAANLWNFTGWSDGVTNATRTVTVPATNITYTANFALQTVMIIGVASPASGGSVAGGGTYRIGTNAQLVASAAQSWLLNGWSDGVTNAMRTVTVPATNLTYTASFLRQTAVISVVASPADAGTVSGGGIADYGSNVTVRAVASAGSTFLGWTVNGESVSPAPNYTFTVDRSLELVANFGGLTITTAAQLPSGTRGVPYSQRFEAAGGFPPYTWAVSAGSLPGGLRLDAATGVLSGQPKGARVSNFRISVTDLQNQTVKSDFSVIMDYPAGPLAGTYTGLLIQTNAPTHASSGFIQIVLANTGSFAGKLTLAGKKTAFTGQFDRDGNATNPVAAVTVELHAAMAGGSSQITGQVTGGDFTAELLASLPDTSPLHQGTYTVVLSPADVTATNLPQGYGYATLVVSRTGLGRLHGVLNDGTPVVAQVPVVQGGLCPLYVSLYQNAGACIGWVSFGTNTTVTAVVDWFKPASADTAAFSTTLTLDGSQYTTGPMPLSGAWDVTLTGGGLVSNLVKAVTIDAAGKVTITQPSVDELQLKLLTKAKAFQVVLPGNQQLTLLTGQFTGSFKPATGGKAITFTGLLLQVQRAGGGLFNPATGLTGGITIEPSR